MSIGPAADTAARPRALGTVLRVNELSKTFPGTKALDDVTLEVAEGEIHALVGQNGSGKTTLAKMSVGLLAPNAGTILLEGRDRTSLRPSETAREIGYVFQNPDHQIFADTVEAEVKFGP